MCKASHNLVREASMLLVTLAKSERGLGMMPLEYHLSTKSVFGMGTQMLMLLTHPCTTSHPPAQYTCPGSVHWVVVLKNVNSAQAVII